MKLNTLSLQLLQVLTPTTLPAFLQQLSNVTNENSEQVVNSPKNIDAVVQILTNVANRIVLFNISINENSMKVHASLLKFEYSK